MEIEKLEGWKYIGKVTHFFEHPSAGIIELTEDELKVGDKIKIRGHTTDIEQTVDSMQVEHEDIQEAKIGNTVGTKVKDRVREHDIVYKAL